MRNRNLLVETVIVELILTILCWVMLPKFIRNQTMAKIHHNEQELARFIRDIQEQNLQVSDELVDLLLQTNSFFLYRRDMWEDEFKQKFPQYSFHLNDNQCIGIDYMVDRRETNRFQINEEFFQSAYPLYVSIVTSDNSRVDHFWRAMNEPSYFFLDYKKIDEMSYIEPKSRLLFSITNGIESDGAFYVDYKGNSWRDVQTQ